MQLVPLKHGPVQTALFFPFVVKTLLHLAWFDGFREKKTNGLSSSEHSLHLPLVPTEVLDFGACLDHLSIATCSTSVKPALPIFTYSACPGNKALWPPWSRFEYMPVSSWETGTQRARGHSWELHWAIASCCWDALNYHQRARVIHGSCTELSPPVAQRLPCHKSTRCTHVKMCGTATSYISQLWFLLSRSLQELSVLWRRLPSGAK